MYLAMKALPVLAVVLFLGNIITGLFWKAHGDRTADPRIISHTLQGIIRSDRWFTVPGLLLIIAFGVAAGPRLLSGRGALWGAVAILTPLTALVLMVHKPVA